MTYINRMFARAGSGRPMRIVILRHGKSSLRGWPWIQARDLGIWIDAYNRAGIVKKPPPGRTMCAARTCSVIVTSDLARSIGSGKALGPGLPLISDALFREAGLPFGPMGSVKLPPMVWALFFRVRWSFGFYENGESIHAFRERSSRAVRRLIALAEEHGSVLFVGHGLINREIARGLLAGGWRGRARMRLHHWAYSEYTRGNP